ncbi:TPA: Rho termination factor N-terminal domain-containing protein [Enterococcus faecium]
MVMRKIRSSITGTEYWDSEKKKTVVVPKGQEPDFEATEEKGILSDGKTFVAVNGELITNSSEILDSTGNTAPDFDEDEATNDKSAEEMDELDNMTAKELRAYAKKHGIDIPGAIRAKGDIINLIREAE